MQNRSESHAKGILIAFQTPINLAECVLLWYVAVPEGRVIFETQFKYVSM